MSQAAYVVLALVPSACSHPLHPVQAPSVQLISETYAPAEIRAALIRALERRKFTPEKEEDGRIVARFMRGNKSARVAVEWSTTQLSVRYLDSAGFGETKDAAGNPMIDTRYDELVAGLDKAIADELQRPAKEAAAAERRRMALAVLQSSAALAQQASAEASQGAADPSQGAADPDQPAADPNQGAAGPTVVQNNVTQYNVRNVRKDVTIVNNSAPRRQPAQGAAWPSFCDKPAKAVWYCPNLPTLQACMKNRGSCASACKVGGGC